MLVSMYVLLFSSRFVFSQVPSKYRVSARVTSVWPASVEEFTFLRTDCADAAGGAVESAKVSSQPAYQYFFTLGLDDGTATVVVIVDAEEAVRSSGTYSCVEPVTQ